MKCKLRKLKIFLRIGLRGKGFEWDRVRLAGHDYYSVMVVPYNDHRDELSQCIDCKNLMLVHNYDFSAEEKKKPTSKLTKKEGK